MKPRRCKYCGVLLYRWSPNCGGICGSPECRRKWAADDPGRSWMRHQLESIRDEHRASRTRSRQAQETIDAFRADIEAMRAGRHDPIPVPGVTCIDCGAVLKESAAADEIRCAKCRRRRKDWLLRLGEWLRSRPAPTPGHCPVCGMKKKAGKPYCSDPCANEAAHWEAIAAWLDGTGSDPTKQTKQEQEGAR